MERHDPADASDRGLGLLWRYTVQDVTFEQCMFAATAIGAVLLHQESYHFSRGSWCLAVLSTTRISCRGCFGAFESFRYRYNRGWLDHSTGTPGSCLLPDSAALSLRHRFCKATGTTSRKSQLIPIEEIRALLTCQSYSHRSCAPF